MRGEAVVRCGASGGRGTARSDSELGRGCCGLGAVACMALQSRLLESSVHLAFLFAIIFSGPCCLGYSNIPALAYWVIDDYIVMA